MSKLQGIRGFSVIELAIVFVIVGTSITLPLGLFRVWIEDRRQQITQERLELIQDALAEYTRKNRALPCPAPLAANFSSAAYARAVVGAGGHCDVSPALAGLTLVNGRDPDGPGQPLSSRVVIGAVPVRTLDISDDLMLDGWGNRIVYAVSANQTQSYKKTGGSIYVEDGASPTPNSVTRSPGVTLYTLVSAGADRVGAYNAEGRRVLLCGDPSPPSSARDNENCDFAHSNPALRDAVFRATTFSRVDEPPALHFDDYIKYVTFIPGLESDICGPKQAFFSPGHPSADADGCVKTIVFTKWIAEEMPCAAGDENAPPYMPHGSGPTKTPTGDIPTPAAAGSRNCTSISNATRRWFSHRDVTYTLPQDLFGNPMPPYSRSNIEAAIDGTQFTTPGFGARGISVYRKTGLTAATDGRVGVRAVVPIACSPSASDDPFLVAVFVDNGVTNEMVASSLLYDVGDGTIYGGNTAITTGERAISNGDAYSIEIKVFSFSSQTESQYDCMLAKQQNLPYTPVSGQCAPPGWGGFVPWRPFRCWAGTMDFGDGRLPGMVDIYERTVP